MATELDQLEHHGTGFECVASELSGQGLQNSVLVAMEQEEDGKLCAFPHLLVLLELDVHIACHFRELGGAIALPEEVAIADLQLHHALDAPIPVKHGRATLKDMFTHP